MDRFEEVLQKLNELAHKSAQDDYIYRGEPKCYPDVSSSLYRKYTKIDTENFEIAVVQSEILRAAVDFVGRVDEVDLQTQLQHFGYNTNLIDFTTDYHIALFFACDGRPEKDGRVILLQKSAYPLVQPRSPENRVIAQKSIFVQPPKGTVEPSESSYLMSQYIRATSEGDRRAKRYSRHTSCTKGSYTGLPQQSPQRDCLNNIQRPARIH